MMKYSLATALERVQKLSRLDDNFVNHQNTDHKKTGNINNIKQTVSNISHIINNQSSPTLDNPPSLINAFEHNIYNQPYSNSVRLLKDAALGKLSIDSNLADSNKKNNSSDSSNSTDHSNTNYPNTHKTPANYVGLKLRVNSDPVFLLAQEWGMLAKWLYVLCRDYGEQTVRAKIEYVSAIADGYFGDAESVATQRGKMTTHLVRSCKKRKAHAY